MQPTLTTLLAVIATSLQIFYNVSYAQCDYATAARGNSITTDNSIGNYTFSDVNKAVTADNDGAKANSLVTVLTANTHYLKITGFNFNLPQHATVCGVSVKIRKWANGLALTAAIRDNEVKLVKGGVISGDNKAKAANWSGSAQETSYGSSGELWNLSFTPNDVNASNFGIAISARLIALLGVLPGAEIDDVELTLHYNLIPLPLKVTGFNTRLINNKVMCSWDVVEQEPNTELILERRNSSSNWTTVNSYTFSNYSTEKVNINYRDELNTSGTYLYRLKIIQSNGRISYSEIKTVSFGSSKGYIKLVGNEVRISTPEKQLYLFNSAGQTIRFSAIRYAGETIADISSLQPGVYILKAGAEIFRFVKQ